MRTFLNILTVTTFVLAFTLLAVVSVWELYPYKTLVFNNGKFPILNTDKTVRQGGLLKYSSNYCKYINQNAVVNRAFVNGLVFSAPTTITNRQVGCHTVIIGIVVPGELPPGKYHLENTYTYQVNPIRKVIIFEETEEFTVIE